MQSVPIYYESKEPENNRGASAHINHKEQNQEQDLHWHPEPRTNQISVNIPPEQWIGLFPSENYGEFESDLREVEKRYNEDRAEFFAAGIRDPELIPCAEQFQDTLAELMTAARLIFDKNAAGRDMKLNILTLMDRILKDCYDMENAVSQHAKWMLEQYPEDEILRCDMTEIDSLFLDFYLDVYNTMGRYKKKYLNERVSAK